MAKQTMLSSMAQKSLMELTDEISYDEMLKRFDKRDSDWNKRSEMRPIVIFSFGTNKDPLLSFLNHRLPPQQVRRV